MKPTTIHSIGTNSRRHFVKQGLQAGQVGLASVSLLTACSNGTGEDNAGRHITDQLLQLSKTPSLNPTEIQQIVTLLTAFNTMYRPHESREDTILFPAFRKLVSRHEYDSLGEEFENNEHKHFGQDGFESMVAKVADIEKQLGIYDLNQFTPA